MQTPEKVNRSNIQHMPDGRCADEKIITMDLVNAAALARQSVGGRYFQRVGACYLCSF
jgi:hypothetical protein